MSPSKLALLTLFALSLLVAVSRLTGFHPFARGAESVQPAENAKEELFEKSGLGEIVQNRLQGEDQSNYAIYIENLASGEGYALNEQVIYPSGSLYKLYLLAVAFEAMEKGEISEDTVVTSTKTHLKQVLGFEDFGYEDAGNVIAYKVSSILSRIATISDNYASIMLAEKLGWDRVRDYAAKLGAKDTKIDDSLTTTALDTGMFLKKLYKKEIVSEKASGGIIELLSNSKINNRIPAKLPIEKDQENRPVGLKIAHKTAELARLRHDAGIVFLDPARGGPYIIVMFSKNLRFEDDGVELLADISKDVYEYFSSKVVN